MMEKLDKLGRSPLHYAAMDGDRQRTLLLIEAGADVNLQDKKGWTPLHVAAQVHSAPVALALIEHGAQIDKQDFNGNTPLFRAVFESRGRGEMISLLRQHGANAEIKNRTNQSPRGLAELIANYNVKQFFSTKT